MKVRPARADEAEELSALALRSKGMWGYSQEFLEQCRAELTLHAGEMERARTHVAEEDGVVRGFFTVIGAPPEGELDALYVDPVAIGRGVGRMLLEAARVLAKREGFRGLAIHSDPYAEAFYLRHGALRVGEVASRSIEGRVLPLLRLEL